MKEFKWRSAVISFGLLFMMVQLSVLYIQVISRKPIAYYKKYLIEEDVHVGQNQHRLHGNIPDKRAQLFPRFSLDDIDPLWSEKVLVAGPGKLVQKRYLTIGFVTAKRPNNTIYMFDTLKSLMTNSNEKEHQDLCIVILVAEPDTEWKSDIIERIKRTYPDAVSNGTIQIIQAFDWIYPKLENLGHHYIGHSNLRVSWKAKQNIDFVLLWLYVHKNGLSEYYLHLEDDVITVKGYIQIMRDFIISQNNRWTCLEFSQLGMIAKLYHTSDLPSLAKIVALFYEEQPADFTYLSFNPLMLQFRRIVRKPTLFQHMGKTSTLKTKTVKVKDSYFIGDFTKTLNGDNPPADIVTTLSDKSTSPEVAYGAGFGCYWTSRSPRKDEFYRVMFKKPQHVRRITVISGLDKYPNDNFKDATLEVSTKVNKTRYCIDYETIGNFRNGTVDVDNVTSSSSTQKIHCFQIKLLKSQSMWVIIQEIAVFLWQ